MQSGIPSMATTQRTNPAFAALTFTNVLLIALILGFGGIFLYVQRSLQRPSPDFAMEEYLAVAQARLDRARPELEQELADLSRDVLPPITEAIAARVQQDYGRYVRTLEREGTVYVANVERMISRKIRARYHDFLQRHREILVNEFPEHASQENIERVLADFENTFSTLVERYYLDEFQRESQRTQALWARFEPARAPALNEPSLEEQLIETATDWAVLVASVAPPSSSSQ
jgi:hypothetical protein